MAVKGTVTGTTLEGEKDKTITVEASERVATVTIAKETVRLDRDTLPALQQLVQAAFIEVS